MKLSVNSKGVSLIAAIFIIVIVAFMGVIFLTLIMTGSSSSLNDFQSNQALYVAQGGLEFIFENRVFPNYSTAGAATNLGAGNFIISTPAYLTGAIGAGVVTVNVNSTTGFPNAGKIVIGSEVLAYNSVTANSFNLAAGTVIAHAASDAVFPVTTVSADPGAAGVTIQVNSTTGFRVPGAIMINNEFIFCTGSTGASFTNCTRQYRGTQPTGHPTGSNVFQFVVTSTGNVGNARRVVMRSLLQSPGAMVAYAHGAGDRTPYYRRWNGYEWGPELQASQVGAGNTIEYMVLKFARTRNEAILGTLDTSGDIRVQVWNGTGWSGTTLLANIGTANDAYRGFDIEYETNGDRAIVVYNDGNATPSYRTWNGAAWSGAGNINVPTAGIPRWIEMARNPLPGSSEIAMILLDSNSDVYGMRWTGAGWNNMGVAAVWDAGASTSTNKAIHVAYEQQTGRALFVWGTNTSRYIGYWIWNGANLLVFADQRIQNIGGNVALWVRLAPDPFSNDIMLGIQDNGQDLITSLWNGAAWDATGTQHDNGTEDQSRNFDIVFETAPGNAGRAWLLWGNGTTLSRRAWTGAWGGIANAGDDTSLAQLLAHPISGTVFSGIYESTASATDDIWETHLIGGSATWTGKFTVWGGPIVAAPVMERVSIGAERINSFVLLNWQEIFP